MLKAVTEPLSPEALDQSLRNYATHKWHMRFTVGTPSEASERIIVCDECGCEDFGNPAEFDWLMYPACDDMDRWADDGGAH